MPISVGLDLRACEDYDFSHFVVLEGCALNSESDAYPHDIELSHVGEFNITMWDPFASADFFDSDRILRSWDASNEWC